MSGNTLAIREKKDWTDRGPDAADVVDLIESRADYQGRTPRNPRGLFRFLTELRRRKVCRAATAYCIALWLTCQVVEVVAEPLGLPEWTLELVIVLGLVCFPIALILSWLFEVTPNGLVLDNNSDSRGAISGTDRPRSRFDQVIDCSLLIVAVVIGAQLALTRVGSNVAASPIETEVFYVMPFPILLESNSEALSHALQIELQRELAQMPTIKVVAPIAPSSIKTGSSLVGSVSVAGDEIQVTAIVVHNKSGELAWSETLLIPTNDSGATPRSIAKGIISALEKSRVRGFTSSNSDG